MLSDVKINPGESKEVTLILTKKMTENNLGTTYNTAEIASVSNSENLLTKIQHLIISKTEKMILVKQML